jgi:hypothetical protein
MGAASSQLLLSKKSHYHYLFFAIPVDKIFSLLYVENIIAMPRDGR